MGYLKIPNLYKDQSVLMFKECYALEKIHGTSAHVGFRDGFLKFFSGGCSHVVFQELFDQEALSRIFLELGHPEVVVYGEACGGKLQRMRETYGEQVRFIAFDVKIGDTWLSVPNAYSVCEKLGLDFVHYVKVEATVEQLDFYRDRDSDAALHLCGCGSGKMREGVVIRPLVEVTKSNGQRVIAKHKRAEFAETKTYREVDPEKHKVLKEAQEIAEEWVTPMRLIHVLDKFGGETGMERTKEVILAMIEDILTEGAGEIVDSKPARTAIGRKTASLLKHHLESVLSEV